MVDDLRSQKSYRRASAILVRAYLKLHDERPASGGAGGAGLPDMSNMTAAEKKRVKAKVRFGAWLAFCGGGGVRGWGWGDQPRFCFLLFLRRFASRN